MIIRCSGCKTTFTFASAAPNFCQECGHSLKDEETHVGEQPSATEVADVTIAPSTTAAVRPGRALKAGERIENYELVNILGSGGMGVVWKAIDLKNGRQVALKKLAKNHLSDQDSVTRFMREAQLASKISHPRVTFVFSAGRMEEQPFIAMELMPGETLADRVKNDGPLPVGEAVDKILDVIDGLDAAHTMGLIHRDVKPSNCFIDIDDRVKIGDFGLSKSVISTEVELTRTGTFMGTPAYAAPEQIRGEKLDSRTDIYAVGATLCNLLTGRPPFVGDAMTVTAQIVADTPEITGDLPKELVRILHLSLEKKRSKRFQTLQELRSVLLPFAQSQNPLAAIGRRVSAYMIDVVLVAVVMGVFLGGFGAYAGAVSLQQGIDIEEMLKPISWIGPILSFILPLLYFFLLEAIFGKTIGKRLLGLKVIDNEGGKPSWGRELLRVFFIPGGAAIPMLLGLLIVSVWPMTTSAVDATLRSAVNSLVSVVPILIILAPLICNRGNEGWHEIISGTHVITDGRTTAGQLLIPDPKPQCDVESTFMLGPYRVGQILHQSSDTTVYLGVDTQLDRNVWVHVCEEEGRAPSEQRILLARLARQRWLDGGFDDCKRWDAFEAIEGLPVQAVVSSRYQVGWPEYRTLLQDVAEEMTFALSDGTMPEKLSLPQVWLDRNGHAKIIDRSLVDVVDMPPAGEDPRSQSTLEISVLRADDTQKLAWRAPTSSEPTSDVLITGGPEEEAAQLLKALGKSLFKGRPMPLSAQTFLHELQRQPNNQTTLTWSIDKLRSLAGKLEKIDWETRVGILGITVGIEYLLYTMISAFMYLLAFFVIPVPNPSRYFVGLTLSLIAPVVLGVIFNGGITFHFMGISVSNNKGKKVGYLKLITRSFLSWLPAVAATGAWMICIIGGNVHISPEEPEVGSLAADIAANPMITLYALLIIAVCLLSQAVGILISLVSPTRGLQDFLIRTRLLPK